jgi:hypothetical protein
MLIRLCLGVDLYGYVCSPLASEVPCAFSHMILGRISRLTLGCHSARTIDRKEAKFYIVLWSEHRTNNIDFLAQQLAAYSIRAECSRKMDRSKGNPLGRTQARSQVIYLDLSGIPRSNSVKSLETVCDQFSNFVKL